MPYKHTHTHIYVFYLFLSQLTKKVKMLVHLVRRNQCQASRTELHGFVLEVCWIHLLKSADKKKHTQHLCCHWSMEEVEQRFLLPSCNFFLLPSDRVASPPSPSCTAYPFHAQPPLVPACCSPTSAIWAEVHPTGKLQIHSKALWYGTCFTGL